MRKPTYWNHDWNYQKEGENKRQGTCHVRHQSFKTAMKCAERKFTKNSWLDWNGVEYGETDHLDGQLNSGHIVREFERQYTVPGREHFYEILK